MKRIALVTSLSAAALVGCSQDADIGADLAIPTAPRSCSAADLGTSGVQGEIIDPMTGETFVFGTPTVTVHHTDEQTPDMVALTDNAFSLQLNLLCAGTQVGDYAVRDQVDQHAPNCPFEASADIGGHSIEYLAGTAGRIVIDDMSNTQSADCLAGRFAIDFGGNGTLTGWFIGPR
ncbi:MAG: hypothetical protein HOV81_16540 [Kofleriaceae bacterium]|nr:hypothetical protein [Kofleriaceae bacterium]